MGNYIQRERASVDLSGNIKRLYRIPKKYKYINITFNESPELKRFLLKILRFANKRNTFVYRHSLTFFLGTDKATKSIRKKTTRSVTNRYMNFLCAMGFLDKIDQKPGTYYSTKRGKDVPSIKSLTKINRNLRKYRRSLFPGSNRYELFNAINTYRLFKFTDDKLQEIEKRSRILYNAGVTKGNISFVRLSHNISIPFAESVYPLNYRNAYYKKVREYDNIIALIGDQISEKGYLYKHELYKLSDINNNEIDKVLQLFRSKWKECFCYKAPNKEETKIYNLSNKKWIFIKK